MNSNGHFTKAEDGHLIRCHCLINEDHVRIELESKS